MLTFDQKSYKKTVVYDPLKSETYKALQENSYAGHPVQEVAAPAHQRVFQPNKMIPGKVRRTKRGCYLLFSMFSLQKPSSETSLSHPGVFSTSRSNGMLDETASN